MYNSQQQEYIHHLETLLFYACSQCLENGTMQQLVSKNVNPDFKHQLAKNTVSLLSSVYTDKLKLVQEKILKEDLPQS